jgi:hypothetical protein
VFYLDIVVYDTTVDFLVSELIASIIKMYVSRTGILIVGFDVPSQLECDDFSDNKEKCRSIWVVAGRRRRRRKKHVLDVRKGIFLEELKRREDGTDAK